LTRRISIREAKPALGTSTGSGETKVRCTHKRIFAIDHYAKRVNLWLRITDSSRNLHLIVDSQTDSFLESPGRIRGPPSDVSSGL
jgi:hypothetical protein